MESPPSGSIIDRILGLLFGFLNFWLAIKIWMIFYWQSAKVK
jgi:uncharacterized membrane protein required for colicin V production